MSDRNSAIARARTVLVCGHGSQARAVITTVGARTVRLEGQPRLTCTGPAAFDTQVVEHLNSTVLPVVNRILHLLGRRARSFQISLANLGAASSADLPMAVSGFSADVPILLAMLSAALQLRIPQDLVATGHIASIEGDIRSVRSLPGKMAAAFTDSKIKRFIYPDVDADSSMSVLAPQERQQIHSTALRAKTRLVLTSVADICGLVRHVFTDEAVVLGALRAGFFGRTAAESRDGSPVDEAAVLLLTDDEARFWRVLDNYLMSGSSEAARRLLLTRARFQIRQRRYPALFGKRLLQAMRTAPPAVRRLKIRLPLLPMAIYIQLCRFASHTDHEDVQYLMRAVSDRWPSESERTTASQELEAEVDRDAAAAVETILGMISAQALAAKIGLPIDTARASFVLDQPTTDSYNEFNRIIEAFYLRLLQHMEPDSVSVPGPMLSSEAQYLLENAFANKGGFDAARAEAADGLHGGLRFVLDAMADYYKYEQQNRYVNQVLTQALDPRDWQAKVDFMKALFTRIGPHLPEEIRRQPLGHLARNYQNVVLAYVRSMDQVRQLLQRY